jgi:hypothetical protein
MATSSASRGARRWPSIVSLWGGLLLALIDIVIGIRFILKLAGASEGNGFVDFIYNITDPLVRPFEGIFDEQTVGDDGIFEPEALIAILVYAIVALILGAILRNIVASAPAPKADTWTPAASDIYVRLSSLHGTLSAAAAVPLAADPGSIARLAAPADAEIDQVSTAVHALELNPPGDRQAAALRDLSVTLNGLRGALRADASRATAAPTEIGSTPLQSGPDTRVALNQQLASLDASLQSLRATF